MDRAKVSGYLSIARKAGYLIIGSDSLKGYDKKLYLVLIDVNAGKNAEKIAQNLAQKLNIGIKKVENLGQLVAIETCKLCAIKNQGLAKIIDELI